LESLILLLKLLNRGLELVRGGVVGNGDRTAPASASAAGRPSASTEAAAGRSRHRGKLLLILSQLLLQLVGRKIAGIPGRNALLQRPDLVLQQSPLGGLSGCCRLVGRGRGRLAGCGGSLLRRGGLGISDDGGAKRDRQNYE
jgi:hypothetical protein